MTEPNGHSDAIAIEETQLIERGDVVTAMEALASDNLVLAEQLRELELAQDLLGWERLDGTGQWEFTRDWLDRLVHTARLMYLKNPIIKRGVELRAFYTFAQGMTTRGQAPAINDAIQAFLDEPGNARAFTGPMARLQRSRELDTDGNLFVALFPDRLYTGRVAVRVLPLREIRQVITNPDDSQEPWFYQRVYVVKRDGRSETRTDYYPDIHFNPRNKPAVYADGNPILWSSPVMHVRVGGFSDMRFGVPEVYAALDWAKAVKSDLEDWATIRKALTRFAWKADVTGGAGAVAALKAKMGTAFAQDSTLTYDTNPPPVAGAIAVQSKGAADLNPIRTAGVQPHPEEGRRIGLMATAALGFPETMVFGDADVGNLATSKTLDRPTELMIEARRELWAGVYRTLFDFVIDTSVRASLGQLKGRIVRDRITGEEQIILAPDPDANPAAEDYDPSAPMSRHIDIDFPTLLDRNTKDRVDATVAANTTGVLPPELVARLLMTALEVDDMDEEMDKVAAYLEQKAAEPAPTPPPLPGQQPDPAIAAEARFTEALRELRDKVRGAA